MITPVLAVAFQLSNLNALQGVEHLKQDTAVTLYFQVEQSRYVGMLDDHISGDNPSLAPHAYESGTPAKRYCCYPVFPH